MTKFEQLLNELLKEHTNKYDYIVTDEESTKEDYDKLISSIDNLKSDDIFGSLFGSFLDYAKNLAEEKRNELVENEKKTSSSQLVKKEVDHSEEKVNKPTELDRPSSHIDVQRGIQIHKLVTEYVDTMIRPYSQGLVDNKVINDAYAGLYEFACWLINK